MAKEFLLHRMTWPEAKARFDQKPCLVVIPIGSTEQHGPHMPLGSDFLEAEAVAHRLGARADVIVTPTLPIGYAKYHTNFPGTLSMEEETLASALKEICDDLVRYGATHILFVCGHGGNVQAIRKCGEYLRRKAIPMGTAVYWQIIQTVNPEWLPLGHGDYIEASMVMAVDETLPRMDVAKVPTTKQLTPQIKLDGLYEAKYKNGWVMVNNFMADVTDTGDMLEPLLAPAKDYTIPPSAASKEMGNTILDGIADYLAEFVEEFKKVRLTPVDEIGPLGQK